MENLFKVVQSDVAVFEGKGYEVILFNVRIWLGKEAHPNSNWRSLLHLVCFRGLTIGNEIKNCEGKWTWEVCKKSVIKSFFFRLGGREDGN